MTKATQERRISAHNLTRLMADAHKRRFDVVVVWKFDRFARSVSHLLRALETFKALGAEFVSFSEQMDTSTSWSRHRLRSDALEIVNKPIRIGPCNLNGCKAPFSCSGIVRNQVDCRT